MSSFTIAYPVGAGGLIPVTGITNAMVAANAAIVATKLSGVLREPTGEWVTVTPPAFGAARTPSATRPTLVTAIVSIDCDETEDGEINATMTGGGTPVGLPQLFIAGDAIATPRTFVQWQLFLLVPAGESYTLTTTAAAGTPTFNWEALREQTL